MSFEELRLLYENMINAQQDDEEIQKFLNAGRSYYGNENLNMQELHDLFKNDLELYRKLEEVRAIQNGEGYALLNGAHIEPQFMTMKELEEDLNRNHR